MKVTRHRRAADTSKRTTRLRSLPVLPVRNAWSCSFCTSRIVFSPTSTVFQPSSAQLDAGVLGQPLVSFLLDDPSPLLSPPFFFPRFLLSFACSFSSFAC